MNEENKPDTSQTDPLPPAPISEPKPVNTAIDKPTPEEQLADAEKKMSRFEKSTLRLAVAAVIMSALAAVFVCLQWVAMEQTLSEMKRSGDTATNQLWQAIGNMNWLARTMDGSLKLSDKAMDESTRQSKAALDASIDASRLNQRAWISVSATSFFYATNKQGVTHADSKVVFVNGGRSPARNVHSWSCARVSTDSPIVSRGPEQSETTCIIEEWGLMGPQIPLSIERPAENISVAENSLTAGEFERGLHYFVWGRIAYQITGEVQTHHTSFCLFFNRGSQLAPCPDGNKGD